MGGGGRGVQLSVDFTQNFLSVYNLLYEEKKLNLPYLVTFAQNLVVVQNVKKILYKSTFFVK